MLAKKRLDKFYRLAKDEGYKSRAAFKLIQLNREYNFLGDCKCLIDLCAAPGGWTQVAAKYMPLSSHIIAVDLEKMKPIPGCVTIQGDITTQKCKFEIRKHLHGYDVDCVLHDGAPNVTGAWSKDAYGQCELTLCALKMTTQFLKVGGLFITKVFRSADYNSLLWVLQQLFESVTSFKPIASRSSSAEIYLICQRYLAPKKIDPRLLDPKFVFRAIEEKPEQISVMQRKKKRKDKPSRTGYDEEHLLYKTASVLKFIQSATPEVILGEYNAFLLKSETKETEADVSAVAVDNDVDDEERLQMVQQHTTTDEEICALLSDLRLLAKSDFRKLLKWRLKMRKYLALDGESKTAQKDDETAAAAAADDEDAKEPLSKEELQRLQDEQLEADVRDMFDAEKRERRKQRRKVRQEKIKQTRVMMMGGVRPDDVWDIADQEQSAMGLFSLKSFINSEELEQFMNGDNTVILPSANANKNKKKMQSKVADIDGSDDELAMNSDALDVMYRRYQKNHGLKSKKESRAQMKAAIGLASDDEFSSCDSLADVDTDTNDEDEDVDADDKQRGKHQEKDEDEDNDMDVDVDVEMLRKDAEIVKRDADGNELVMDEQAFVLKEDTKMTKAKRWFSDNIFDDIETNDALDEQQMAQEFADVVAKSDEDKVEDDDDDDAEFEVVPGPNSSKTPKTAAKNGTGKNAKDGEDGDGKNGAALRYADLPDVLKLPYKVRMKLKKMTRDHRRRLAREEHKRQERDCLFEEVPETLDADSTDSEAIAEVQALGAKMLQKKDRMQLIDDSYHRFAFDAFDDECNVPQWFADDENANYGVNLPVTKEEIREHKERLKAINARPIKKVAEAKARKKLKAQRIWNKIKKQATVIADNNDLSEKSKIKQIEKLYGKLGKKKQNRVYMVGSAGRKHRPADGKKPAKNAVKVYVDKRMKTDKRAIKFNNKRKLAGKIKKAASSKRQKNAKNKRRNR
eukprot:CAMPEP_0202698920 /NCGR_PEP_ID=MMETSP1385-20130828/12155_1 /ASSEMBLY_ACC=CAM_ASM_000861 /TAXON_ID=933848 /ORGANISM="Elphidium margaritaceum" /LENGTH=967 /DNA_ID=CAMNT_0049355749 /DNA_START=9 /DNA_END=2912 /DNA_ORIENTATION=+